VLGRIARSADKVHSNELQLVPLGSSRWRTFLFGGLVKVVPYDAFRFCFLVMFLTFLEILVSCSLLGGLLLYWPRRVCLPLGSSRGRSSSKSVARFERHERTLSLVLAPNAGMCDLHASGRRRRPLRSTREITTSSMLLLRPSFDNTAKLRANQNKATLELRGAERTRSPAFSQ